MLTSHTAASTLVQDYLDPDTLTPIKVNPRRMPRLNEGYYRTAAIDNAVVFSYFYVVMREPISNSLLKLDAKYPVLLLTNTALVKRSCAVCSRAYGEYRRLRGFLQAVLKRNRDKVEETEEDVPELPLIPSICVEKRKRAIEVFVNALVSDTRVFNVPLFHAFFYTSLSAEELFDEHTDGQGVDQQRLNISSEMQDYELEILPGPLTTREILQLAKKSSKKVKERVGIDIVNYNGEIPEELGQDSSEDDHIGTFQSFDERDGIARPISIPTLHCSDESSHSSLVTRSFINFGHEERVAETPDGKIRVFDPNPVAIGSCPDRLHCPMQHQQRRPRMRRQHHHRSSTQAISSHGDSSSNRRVAESCPWLLRPLHSSSSLMARSSSSSRFTPMGSDMQTPEEEEETNQADLILEESETSVKSLMVIQEEFD